MREHWYSVAHTLTGRYVVRIDNRMKKDELIVAEALKLHFENAGYAQVSYDEPLQDPPDLILNLGADTISVEITKADENSLNQRTSIGLGYRNFIKSNLGKFLGALPSGITFLVVVYHGSQPVRKIKKSFQRFLLNTVSATEYAEEEYLFVHDNIGIKLVKIAQDKSPRTFPMILQNRPYRMTSNALIAPLDIQLARIVSNAISEKTDKCQHIPSPKWLVLHDFFSDKFCTTIEEKRKMYQEAFDINPNSGDFSRILVVFEEGVVMTLFAY